MTFNFTNIGFVKRFFFLSSAGLVFNFIIFIILDNLFYLNPVEKSTGLFYLKYLLSTLLINFFLFILIKKIINPKSYEINIKNQQIDLFINTLLCLSFLGLVLFFFSKYFYYNYYFDLTSLNGCSFNKIRELWILQSKYLDPLKNQSPFIYYFYQLLSPLGTVLINLSYVLIFFLIFFIDILTKKKIFFINFFLISVFFVYYLFIFSKNVFITSFCFFLTSYVLYYIIFGKFSFKILANIFVYLIIYSMILIYSQILRYDCHNQVHQKNTGVAFSQKQDLERFSKENNLDSVRMKYVIKKDIKTNTSVTYIYNYILYYILTGKHHGDHNIFNTDLVDKKNKSIVLKRNINLFFSDLTNQILPAYLVKKISLKDVKLDVPQFEKNLGPVSLVAYLYLDYSFFGISILMLSPFLLLIINNTRFKNLFYISNAIFIFLFHMMIFNIILMFICHANEILNTRIFYFNFLIILLLFFKKSLFIKKIDPLS